MTKQNDLRETKEKIFAVFLLNTREYKYETKHPFCDRVLLCLREDSFHSILARNDKFFKNFYLTTKVRTLTLTTTFFLDDHFIDRKIFFSVCLDKSCRCVYVSEKDLYFSLEVFFRKTCTLNRITGWECLFRRVLISIDCLIGDDVCILSIIRIEFVGLKGE